MWSTLLLASIVAVAYAARAGGCTYNKEVYAVGEKWVQKEDLKGTVAGNLKLLGTGVVFKCVENSKGEFIAQAYGCLTTKNWRLNNNSLASYESMHVRCKVSSDGKASLETVGENEVACTINDTKVKSGSNYTTPDGVDLYHCKHTTIKKIGCVISGQTYTPNDYKAVLIKKKYYRCNTVAGVFDFGKITGCKLKDGSVKEFHSQWISGTEFHGCEFSIKGNKVTASINVLGCEYNKKLVGKDKVVGKASEVQKCAQVGKVWKMRDLTKEENAANTKPNPKKGRKSSALSLMTWNTLLVATIVAVAYSDQEGGCKVGKTVYAEREKWVQNEELKATVSGSVKIVGTGVAFKCIKNSKGEFSAQAYGCVTSTGWNLNNGSLATFESTHIKCNVASDGKVTLAVPEDKQDKEVFCSLNGMKVKSGENYTAPDGVDVYHCKNSTIEKIGCVIDGKTHRPHDSVAVYTKKKVYRCNTGAGVFDFGKTTGCKHTDGSIKQFNSKWIVGNEFHGCEFSIKGKKVTASINVLGCQVAKTLIPKNMVVGKGPGMKKCALVGKVYVMRELTDEENATYAERKKAGK